MKRFILKWLLFGVGFGAAFGCVWVALPAVMDWYASRPKTWNQGAVTADFHSWSMDAVPDGAGKYEMRVVLEYSLRNRTGRDYVPNASNIRTVLKMRIPRDGDQRSELMAITIPK